MTLQPATIVAVVAVIVGLLVVGYALVTYLRRRRIRMTPEHLVIERRRGGGYQPVRELAWREVKRLEPQHGRHGPLRPGPRLVEVIIRNRLPESVAVQEWEAAVTAAERRIEATRADARG
ncbi:hypothetical protein USB125703_01379 [Pseudoclavibacter triregionum]|nr:hypothetical protein USB125703_01379 [Pseudoclavibacter triregionum]